LINIYNKLKIYKYTYYGEKDFNKILFRWINIDRETCFAFIKAVRNKNSIGN